MNGDQLPREHPHLVVMFHGYGQDETYFDDLLTHLPRGTSPMYRCRRRTPAPADGIIMLSGIAVDIPHAYFNDKSAAARDFPIFVGKDPQDGVLPKTLVTPTDRWLTGFTNVTVKHYEGMGHRVSAVEADDVASFLEETLRFAAD